MDKKRFLRFIRTASALTTVLVMTAYSVLSTQNAVAQGLAEPVGPAETAAQAAQVAQLPTSQIIVHYRSQSDAFVHPAQSGQLARMSQTAGVTLEYVRAMSGDAHVLRLPARMPVSQVQAITTHLMTLPEVAYAEPDRVMYETIDPLAGDPGQATRALTLTPNDPLYAHQWDMKSAWGIDLPAAWNTTTGSTSVVVAVIDTGLTHHAEFTGRTVPGYDFIGDPLVANDGGGRDSDPSDPGDWITAADSSGATFGGWFTGCPVRNSSWHGTHTAGTIGATGNNALGVAGINWKSKIEAVRVLGKCGGYTSDVIDGMRWAAGLAVAGVPANAHPAKVLSISLGGPGACSPTMQSTLNQIRARGAVVVVAAGNSSTDASGFNPGNCNNVITVGATGFSGDLTYYSNFGATVEISAPGGEEFSANDPHGVLSTFNTGTQRPAADTYRYDQGTSMAAPHVSGVVSLLFSLNPALTPPQVLTILRTSAKAFPAGAVCTTSTCGSGIVDAGAALARAIITVSGTTGVAGTVLHYTDGTAKTATADGSGNYSFNVPYNWSGSVSPSESHHTFTPDHIDYSGLVNDQTAQDYTPNQFWYLSGNAGIAGATISYTDGTLKTVTSDGGGNYSLTVSDGFAGTVTPSKTGVTFTPTNLDYSSTPVTGDLTGQNFTTDQVIHTISGKVNATGATLSFTDDAPESVVSDSSGNYSLLVSDGWNETITPSKAGVGFTPAFLDYSAAPVTTDLTGQNFTAGQSFLSVAVQDGWVLESSETSGLGGTLDSTANTLQLGDDRLNRQYRAILSFNTSALPDNALIQSAKLKIRQSGAVIGSNPFTVLGSLWIDIRLGAFGTNALQVGDFSSAASANQASVFNKTPAGGWYTNTLNATGIAQLNKAGLTQFRLYFAKDDNNNHVADYIRFVSGNYASSQPILVISYTLP